MLTSRILMIRPAAFAFNGETAVNNAFQSKTAGDINALAVAQFDDFVAALRANGIEVSVIQDTPLPHTPDSVFPNNWISFHEGGAICLYPMFAANRRQERKNFEAVKKIFDIKNIIDLTGWEKQNKFLEGTGSMVFDRDAHIAYAAISPRMDSEVLRDFCDKMNFKPLAFSAADAKGQAVYHTNVLMCIGQDYAVICMESIARQDRQKVKDSLLAAGKEIVEISLSQMENFAGNMLQVKNKSGKKFLAMSQRAFAALTPGQIGALKKHNDFITAGIHTIETNGGGSARCMIAEVF